MALLWLTKTPYATYFEGAQFVHFLLGPATVALAVPLYSNLLRVEDHAVRGFAAGVAAHGIGTARTFQVSETMGAFAGLAMGLNGLLTAFLFPVLVRLWER